MKANFYHLVIFLLISSMNLVANVGNYLDFNGSSNYVNCGNPASLQISGDLTIEAWIYCESVTGNGNVIVSRALDSETEAGNILYQLRILTDRSLRLMWETGSGTNKIVTSSAGVISNNTWHHVAAVRYVGSSSSVYLFVDGVLVKSQTGLTNPSGGTDANQHVWIGANYQDGDFRYWFNGKIDEVRIWNTTRTSPQIRDNMYNNLLGNESGLAGYWKFDENTGPTVYDETDNSNNGTIYGASWVTGNLTIGNDETFQVDIIQNTYWRSDIIDVRSNIWVLNGATLKIFPGATVSFSEINSCGLIIENGTLLAIGKEDQQILFTPQDEVNKRWRGIRFDKTPTSNADSRIEFCTLEHAKGASAVWLEYGGALDVNNFSKLSVENCTFKNNYAYKGGGGISCRSSNISIINTLIIDNYSGWSSGYGYGHGIYLYNSSPTITNCTICNNITSGGMDRTGNGIYSGGSSSPNVKNCLLYWNSLEGNPQATSATNISYSNVQDGFRDGFTETGNIFSDPKIMGSGNYRLQSSSPCINAGDPATSGLPSTDLDGSPRIYDGLVDQVDMGAFEYQGDAAPIITSHPSSATKQRGESVTFSVTATGVSLTYQWRKNSGNISGATSSGYTIASVAESDEASYDCVVTSGNASSTSNTATLAVNDAPTNIALSSSSINENESSGTTVGTLSSTDPDASDTHSYSLVSGEGNTDNASFAISGGSLRSAAVFDYETKSSYSILIRTTDNGSPGLTYEEVFSITINNVNEAPTDIALSSTNINENESSGTTVGTLSSTDSDAGASHSYSLVSGEGSTDNASFAISGGSLQSAVVFDYETKSSYSVRIRTTDNGSPGLTYEEVFSITINNVNDAPTDITLSSSTINENESSGTTVGTLSSTDSDAGASHSYSLVTGEGSTNNASFAISGSTLKSAAVFDYESKSSYSILIRTTDNGSPGLTFDKVFTITVVDQVEDPPVISSHPSSVTKQRGESVTFSVVASGESLSYQWRKGGSNISSANLSSYTIASITGDDEAAYDCVVSNIAGNANSNAATLTVNDAPTDISLSSSSIHENLPTGVIVGNLSSTDPDDSDTHSYTLVSGTGDTDNASFTISGSSLQSAAVFDYETKNSYSVHIKTTDNGSPGLSVEKAFTITISNVVYEGSGPGFALDFDGGDEYVILGDLGSFQTATVEFWMRADNADGDWQGLVSSDGWDTGYLHLPVGGDIIDIYLHLGGSNRGRLISSTLTNGVWYHIALTMDVNNSNAFKLYKNGVLEDTDDISAISTVVLNSMVIGRESEMRYFDGAIDEVRIWNDVRSAEEIRANMHKTMTGDESGLYAYWHLNEGTGSTASNTIGNSSFDGTLVNMEEEDWLSSPAPCGRATCHSSGSVTSATSILGNLTITPTDAFDNAVDIFVTEIPVEPNTFGGISGNKLHHCYWVVNVFGTPGTFTANLTFTLPEGYLNTADSQIQLYRRSSNSITGWTAVGTLGTVTATTVQFTGITSFSQFTLGSDGESSLPVEFTDFTAIVRNGTVVLTWTTESEIENQGFIIEKEENGVWAELASFVEIDALKGHGSTSEVNHYQFIDRQVSCGQQYGYRISDVDYRGERFYHPGITVIVPDKVEILPKSYSLYPVYPNPFNPVTSITFELPRQSDVTLLVYDISGRLVETLLDRAMNAGRYTIRWDASSYPSGVFIYRIQAGDFQQVRKCLLVK